MPDYEATVRARLAAEGFAPEDSDVTALASSYPHFREMANRLRQVSEAHEEFPELIVDLRLE